MRLSKLYLWAVCLTVLAGLSALFAVVLGWFTFGFNDEDAVGTGIIVIGYFLFGLGCTAVRDRGRAPRLMLIGVLVGFIALALWMFWIWATLSGSQQRKLEIIASWPTAVAFSIILVGFLALPRGDARPLWWRTLRYASVLMVCALALEVCLAVTFVNELGFEFDFIYEDFLFNAMMPLILLTSLSFAITMMTAWLPIFHHVDHARLQCSTLPYLLICPRCGKEQQARTGEHHCSACGLRARVELA